MLEAGRDVSALPNIVEMLFCVLLQFEVAVATYVDPWIVEYATVSSAMEGICCLRYTGVIQPVTHPTNVRCAPIVGHVTG